MSEHHFDPLSQFCDGCGIARRDVCDPPRAKGEHAATAAARVADCPAQRFTLSNLGIEAQLIIRPDETMLLYDGRTRMEFDKSAMFGVRDAIDDGVRQLRAKDGN